MIDEADRMADMGFLPAVRRILQRTRNDRQVLLFSATFDRAVTALAAAVQHRPVRHEIARDSVGGLAGSPRLLAAAVG